PLALLLVLLPPVKTPVTPVTTPTTPPIAPPNTPPTGPAALLPSRAPFSTPWITCASARGNAPRTRMVANPMAAHIFQCVRSLDVGLVIVGLRWWSARTDILESESYRFRREQVQPRCRLSRRALTLSNRGSGTSRRDCDRRPSRA